MKQEIGIISMKMVKTNRTSESRKKRHICLMGMELFNGVAGREGVTYYFSRKQENDMKMALDENLDAIPDVFDENGLLKKVLKLLRVKESEEAEITKNEEPLTESESEDIKEEKVVQVFKGWHYDKGWYYYNTNGNKLYGWRRLTESGTIWMETMRRSWE